MKKTAINNKKNKIKTANLHKQSLPTYTPYTLTSPSALEGNFSDIQTKVFSYDNQ
ncbi:hypothetical protein [Arsenophonus sp.]|uniref:hypothetical protein n=1 Tax=Arsenophonus sp. TaxID=1872640 RepID=UPI00286452CA|nr:hypothetical protein [Arsenophonus sp.]MDR5609946.1 hypothetical protein [Arsenophonus sp.]MDR5613618.1 hypothetical protein [Arsenophonus sp.]